jgi:trimeric autotransporter adhesin
MKIIKSTIFSLFLLCSLSLAKAQVSGTKTIPGDYATLSAAITDLNTNGIGAGGATINVAAGYTETLSAGLTLTISSSESRPLTIQKSGSGANPLITAHIGAGTLDGLFIINGSDYVTINGIDLQENAANTTATTQMEWGYALLKVSGTDGARNNTIKNCKVTLNQANALSAGVYVANHTIASTTGLIVTAASGTNSNNKFLSNIITNTYNAYSLSGFTAAAPYDLFDQNNEIGKDPITNGRSQITQFGGGTAGAAGIATTSQNNIKISGTNINNTGGLTQTGTLEGIRLSTANNANVDITFDTVSLTSNATTSNLIGISNGAGAIGAGNTININNCKVLNCSYPTATSGIFRGIASTATASYTNISNNEISGNNLPGTGELSGIYYNGSSATLVLNVNINNNLVNNNTKTGTGGIMNCIFASASCNTMNTFSNQIFNNSNANSSAATYGYFNFAFGLKENVYNNQIHDITGGTGEVAMLHVRSGSGPTNKEVYGNEIYNISGAPVTSTVYGIWLDYGTVSNIYKNNIYNITNTAVSTATPAISGITIGSNNNQSNNIYNNFISDLKAPSATNTFASIMGIWCNGPVGSVNNLYHNTVYLNANGTGTNFGSSALYLGPNILSADVRNNIFVNTSNTTGTGLNRAITRSNTSLTNYAMTSGNNCLYAGTPSATNLLMYDLTNAYQTIAAVQGAMGGRELGSFSDFPLFVNAAVAPYDLHLTAGPNACESAGSSLPFIPVDIDGNARNIVTPDVGADEFNGVSPDVNNPNITYTVLSNDGVATSRTLTAFASITDRSGINTSAGTSPRLYYKKSSNANTYNDNTSGTDGWKYVQASNTSSPFSFTINYSQLFGGAVAAGDVIQYFVIAQDLAAVPNVSLNASPTATSPSSVNLAAANFGGTGVINQYTIVANTYSGTINVGPTETITSLTNTGGMFDRINTGALSGNLTINITGDLTAETGTVALNQWAENGTGGTYSVSIVPSAATTRTISGSSAAASLIRLDGADRVTIDGRFAGAGRFLLFRNTSNSAPTIGLINDAKNNTIRSSVIESGNTATSTTLGGTIFIGTTTGTDGNDNIAITDNDIKDRSDVAGTSNFAINCVGTNTAITQYNNNITISDNLIHDWFLVNGGNQSAINVGTGNSNFTISGNSIYQTATRTNTASGASTRAININFASTVNSNGGHNIFNNFIGGTAAGATGSDMTLTVSGAGTTHNFLGISMSVGLIPNNIYNNTIRKIDFTNSAVTSGVTIFSAINTAQGIFNIGTNGGNMVGDSTVTNSIKLTINTGGTASNFAAGIFSGSNAGYSNIQNNTVAGWSINGAATSPVILQCIQHQGTPSAAYTISNNKVGSNIPASISLNHLGSSVSFAIRNTVTSGAPLIANNNSIRNISDNTTATTSALYGLYIVSTVGSSYTTTLANNTVEGLSTASAPASASISLGGIVLQNMNGANNTIQNNNVSNLSNTNTSAASAYTVGIGMISSGSGGDIKQNRISNLNNFNTGTNPGIAALYLGTTGNLNVNNNMISARNSSNTNAVEVSGIFDAGSNNSINAYYNSVYVGGSTASGVLASFAYLRNNNSNLSAKNNLFYNERIGGTGNHVAMNVATANGWNAASINNNGYITADTSKIATLNATTYNFNNWKLNSGSDANSAVSTTAANTPSALFVNANTADLHINTSRFPEGYGTPIASVTTDYDGNARSTTFPSLGADELACSSVTASATSTNVTCNGANNGSITVAASGGNALTYAWSPSAPATASITNLAPGTYTCTITNNCGNNTTASATITQPALITNSQAITKCFGQTYTIGSNTYSASGTYTDTLNAANGCDSIVTTNLTVGALITNSQTLVRCAGQTVTVGSSVYNTTGIYTDTLTAANGCDSIVTTNLTVNPLPNVTANATLNSVCAGSNVTLTGSGALSYVWNNGVNNGTAFAPSATTTYTVTGTDVNGCTDSASVTITVNALPIVNLGGNQSTCNPSLTLDAGNPGNTYLWSNGATTQTINATTSGTYSVTVTTPNGCSDADTITVTLNSVLIAGLTPATGSVCVGTPAITLVGSPAGGTYSANAAGGVFNPTTAGTFNVTYIVSNVCGTDTADATITVNALPVANISTSSPTICSGGVTGVTLTGTPAGGTFTMQSGNPAALSGNTFNPSTLGNYTIVYTYTNAANCTDTAQINFNVNCTVGLNDINKGVATIQLAPNPTSGLFDISINHSGSDKATIKLLSFDGKVISVEQVVLNQNDTVQMNASHLANGIYFVNVVTGNINKTLKVTKQD